MSQSQMNTGSSSQMDISVNVNETPGPADTNVHPKPIPGPSTQSVGFEVDNTGNTSYGSKSDDSRFKTPLSARSVASRPSRPTTKPSSRPASRSNSRMRMKANAVKEGSTNELMSNGSPV